MQIGPIADTLRLGDVAMATTFWLSMGYNFSCVIASDTLFDYRERQLCKVAVRLRSSKVN